MPSTRQSITMRRRRGMDSKEQADSDSDDGDTVPLNSIKSAQEVMTMPNTTNPSSCSSGQISHACGESEKSEQLRGELETERELRKDFERQKGDLEIELRKIMEDFSSTMQGKGKEIAALNGMNGHLQSQVRELQCLLNEAKETKASAKTNAPASLVVKELQKRITTLEEELSHGEELLTGMEGENEVIRKELEEAHVNIQDLDDERKETQIQIKELEKELESAVVEMNDLKEKYRQKNEQETILKSEINTLMESNADLERRLSEMISNECTSKASESESKALHDAAFAATRVMELEQQLERMKEASKTSEVSNVCAPDGKPIQHEVYTEEKQDTGALERELKSLMEEKIALESAKARTEMEMRKMCEELDMSRHSLAKIQAEYDCAVREAVEVRSEATATRDALIDSQKQVNKLEKRCEALEKDANEKEDHIVEVENELFQLRQEVEAASEETSSHQIAALQAQIQKLTEDLEIKNARIEKLEKSKLTKDQLDKIKAIKDEKTRLVKENKRLMAQCSSNNPATVNSVDTHSFKELQTEVNEKTLQIQEYEKERQNILEVLEKQGFSISKHLDSSFNLNSTMDHSDLCISSSLAEIIESLRAECSKVVDQDEFKSLEEVNLQLLKENGSLRRQVEKEKRSHNISISEKVKSAESSPSTAGGIRTDQDKENVHAGDKCHKRTSSALGSEMCGDKVRSTKKAKPVLSEREKQGP